MRTSNKSPSVVRHVRLLIGNSAVVEFFRPLRGALLPTSPGSVVKGTLVRGSRDTYRLLAKCANKSGFGCAAGKGTRINKLPRLVRNKINHPTWRVCLGHVYNVVTNDTKTKHSADSQKKLTPLDQPGVGWCHKPAFWRQPRSRLPI